MRVPKWALVAVLATGGMGSMQASQPAPKRIPKVPAAVMSHRLLVKVAPVYPLEAREYGVQGNVTLNLIVGTEGKVESVDAVSGPKMLMVAATDAVRGWIYKPYLLNGKPSEVVTTAVVNFSLSSRLSDQRLPLD